MNRVKRTFFSVLAIIYSVSNLIWLLYDHFLTVGNLNQKKYEQVQSDERSINGKIVIVTGSNSGIGKRTTLELARRGAKVIMACRDLQKAEQARQDILNIVPQGSLEIMSIDMADLQSIHKFVDAFKCRYNHLDVLVNNAGYFSHQFSFTKHGFEKHIGVNYLGSYLLTRLLLDLLIKADRGRIVFLSSSTVPLAVLDLDNIMMEDQQLGLFTPYSNSKLCLAIFSKHLAELLVGTKVTTYALCTGLIRTNLIRDKGGILNDTIVEGMHKLASVSLEQGCATVLHCILSKSLETESGRFYRYLTVWKPAEKIIRRYCTNQLWTVSSELVGLERFPVYSKSCLKSTLKCNSTVM